MLVFVTYLIYFEGALHTFSPLQICLFTLVEKNALKTRSVPAVLLALCINMGAESKQPAV